MLRPCYPAYPDEALLSYACRLAYRHTGQGLRRLLADLRINGIDFEAGEPDAVLAFAEAIGAEPQVLSQNTIRRLKRYNRFRGEDFSRSFLSGRIVQLCSSCLIEQGGKENWHCPIIWSFASVPICARHACVMKQVEAEDVIDLRDLPMPETSEAEPATVGEHIKWLGVRLEGQPVSQWLAGQSIEQVLHSSEMLGLVMLHGEKVRPKQLSRQQRSEAMEAGFLVYREGEAAIRTALSDIRCNAVAQAVQAGPLATYGPLFDWLDRRANMLPPGPIKAILREHILEHEVWASDEMLLGERVKERRLHSVKSLSETLKTDRRRMSRLLQKLGLVPEGATDAESGKLVFPVQEIEQLVQDYHSAVPLALVPEYLGGSKAMVLALYGAGQLKSLIPADAPGAVRKVVFARRELDRVLAVLDALPLAPAGRDVDIIQLAGACQRFGVRAGDALTAILTGQLAALRGHGGPSLHALHVERGEILKFRDKVRAMTDA
ncbi:TniQ family protein [Falsigemmobacter faecalis]|uniref:TniQ domain-containing protein n=1 Tax=Falsigemmobacter faecalis TaxID=2488730 RepID=A0A3P3DXB6_9RHOB|nr:TniQ family protein [Falsigemmobacter faecalis]RRH77398.1 hypothetical protein EG244_04180 [Falsigemmobacter faecalis]